MKYLIHLGIIIIAVISTLLFINSARHNNSTWIANQIIHEIDDTLLNFMFYSTNSTFVSFGMLISFYMIVLLGYWLIKELSNNT